MLQRSRALKLSIFRLCVSCFALSCLFVPGLSQAQVNERPIAQVQEYTQTCGICHLENGEGVPGAYPPLNQRLAKWSTNDAGAKYLVGVVANGLHGTIKIDGQSYVGSMPGMSSRLSSEQMAALLNFVIVSFGEGQAVFTLRSVEEIRDQITGTSSLSLRPK